MKNKKITALELQIKSIRRGMIKMDKKAYFESIGFTENQARRMSKQFLKVMDDTRNNIIPKNVQEKIKEINRYVDNSATTSK
jgi:hypothetical protein